MLKNNHFGSKNSLLPKKLNTITIPAAIKKTP